MNSIKMLYNPTTVDFFKHPERIGDTPNIIPSLIEVFNDVYGPQYLDRNKSKKMRHYDNINQHTFFKL